MGLPVKRFIAATNVNDTVPRYLENGKWLPHQTIATLSNAMDVSQPNNWPRIEELFQRKGWSLSELAHGAVTDEVTKETVRELDKKVIFLSHMLRSLIMFCVINCKLANMGYS